MLERFVKFWTSLKLTVVCLAFAIVLVFVGTVAQADEGLYAAQSRYFKHWLVWGISFFGHQVPLPLPGGYLIGTVLLINLMAAHFQRFQLTWKKLGIHLTHFGVIVLLLGQLATDLLSRETQMQFREGETRWHTESAMDYELAFVRDLDKDTEEAVVIPCSMLAETKAISHEGLPFSVRIATFWQNSEPSFRAPMAQNAPPLATNGVARHFDFRETTETLTMDDKNVPTALIELHADAGSLGTWVVSGWASDPSMVEGLRRFWSDRFDASMAGRMAGRLTEPQIVTVAGQDYTVSLRPTRSYEPFALTLLKTTHDVYRGTTKPKNFQSRVEITNPDTGEQRPVDIRMNEPLRYGGLTYYQHQMASADRSSTLLAVRNPAWLTPYAGCALVFLGLFLQFMFHLVGFIAKRSRA